jgi:hypothetical protein
VTPGTAGDETGSYVNEVCPVCRWPDGGAAVCGVCGWRLLGDYELGPGTWASEREFAARLADARRRFTLRAAVRAAGPAAERDRDLLDRLAVLAGGGARPDPEMIKYVEDEMDATDAPVAETSDGIGFALTRLVTGLTEAISFVEVGKDEIAVQTLACDPAGVPVRLTRDSLRWTEFLPLLLPADADLRYLRLAADVGPIPEAARHPGSDSGPDAGRGQPAPAALLALIEEAIGGPVLDRLTAAASAAVASSRDDGEPGTADPSPRRQAHRVDTVLVRRTYRWPMLDSAVAQVRAFLRPVAEIVVGARGAELAEVVEVVSARAPLRYGYDLILAEVDSSSLVGVKPYPLFPAGAAAVPGLEAVSVPLAPARRYSADRVALPIVARRTPAADYQDLGALAADRPLVLMTALDGTFTGPVGLMVKLAGPGRVQVGDAQHALRPDATPAPWPELLASLPIRLPTEDDIADRALDLVLLVELGGRAETVRARVRLAREVIDQLRTVPGQVRAAVLGYRDHFGAHHIDAIGRWNQEDEALVVGGKLTSLEGARSLFKSARRWQPVPIADNQAAPIEDALQSIITDPDWKWARSARHVLLTIGRRPPHPSRTGPDGDSTLPCPHRWSWQESLQRLVDLQALQCFAVLDGPAAAGYAERAWEQLGARERYDASSVTAERVVRDVADLARMPAVELGLAILADATSPRPSSQERIP